MRWFLSFLLLSLAGPLFAQESKRYAIIVGINEYQHSKLGKLNCAINDATDLGKILSNDGYLLTLLTNNTAIKPTKAEIDRAIESVLQKAKPQDTVLIALSGHGLQFDKEAYFCPMDAKPFPDESRTLVSLNGIYNQFDKSFAGVKVLFVDACRDDPDPARSVSKGIDADSAPEPPKGVMAMFSCSARQRSYEDLERKHGVFFHYVIEGLTGKAVNADGEVTFTLLNDYVAKRVNPRVLELYKGAQQIPNMVARTVGASPVLVNEENNKIARELLERSSYPGGGKKYIEDHKDRISAWKKAAEKGNPAAMTMVGTLHNNGIEATKSNAQALVWYRKAAERGESNAIYLVGVAYLHGYGVAKDEVEAVKWFKKAADAKLPTAMWQLGECCANGRGGLSKDDAEALKWYKKAAEAGNTPSMIRLGNMCRDGSGGLIKNETEAVNWYKKAAEAGNSAAMSDLGFMYRDGRGGMAKDEVEAVKWFKKAAEAGNAQGMHNLGNMFANGRGGLSKDDVEAVKWYKKAAEAGEPLAMSHLGLLFEKGNAGLTKDDVEAAKWYKKAAELGNAVAMSNLGNMYRDGRGSLPKDDLEMIKWYRKSAEAADDGGMANLGWAYQNGRGVTQDQTEAIKWYRKAAAKGNEFAKDKLKALGKNS